MKAKELAKILMEHPEADVHKWDDRGHDIWWVEEEKHFFFDCPDEPEE